MQVVETFKANKLLRELSTIKIGGAARFFREVKTIEELQQALKICELEHIPFFIVGKGSNCLFDDRGFNGVIIKNTIDFLEEKEGTFHVGAGYSFALLGVQTARNGWSGLEFASGIPGSVGGAVYMNAGAGGWETCDCLESVDFMTSAGEKLLIPKKELTFGYRYSSFQEKKGVIFGATFKLTKKESARQDQITLINYRIDTQPYNDPSAGCVFRNPSQTSAGGLIDKAGLKGLRVGDAEVSEKHANFIVNRGNASSKDVQKLIMLIKEKVKAVHGVDLEIEIRLVPYEG